MALTLYANTSGTITQLNDGNPFRLESAEGLSGADVVRHEQRGPYQSGVTDLGFRLQARVLTLHLLFYATTAATLDTYRATLMAAFKPLDDTSTFLSVQRDDGEIRTLTVFTVGDIDISLVPDAYPGHLHRATLNLRAASPLWRANSVTIGSATFASSWWLAGGAIDAANVLYYTEYPPQDTLISPFAGTITGDWSVAFVTAKDTANPTDATHKAWADAYGGSVSFQRVWDGSNTRYYIDDPKTAGTTAWPGTTGYNYHVVESRSGIQYWRYWTNGSITAYVDNSLAGTVGKDFSLSGESRFGQYFTLRGDRFDTAQKWTPDLQKFAIYGTVTINQLQALGAYMFGSQSASVSVVNDGDIYAYPLITLTGPINDPVIVNTTTASTIDLTGGTISTGQTWTIDLRNGNKQIYNQFGTSVLGSVTTLPIQLASFNLAPNPVAAGGTNTITVTSGSVGTATAAFSVQITNQYLSF